jgi:mono/diheme cytochrome c family protein
MLGLEYLRGPLLPYVSLVLGVAGLLSLSRTEVSAQTAPTGKVDYRNYCASCHGTDGAGDKEADIPGPDLTHLSKKHGGVFPFQEVYEVIDGRRKAAAHERLLDMPLWGVYFQPQGVSKGASEAKVKSRITDLVRYIQSLQDTQSLQQK